MTRDEPRRTRSTAPTATRPGARDHAWGCWRRRGFFLITLDILIVNVALAQIERELGAARSGSSGWSTATRCCSPRCCCSPGTWPTGSARNGPSASASPCSRSPRSSARWPRRSAALIAARAVQGAAAAVMLPASMALIREAFPDPGRRAPCAGGVGGWRRGRGRARSVAGRGTDHIGLAVGVRGERPGLRGDARAAGQGGDLAGSIRTVRLGRPVPWGGRSGRIDVRADRRRRARLRITAGGRHPGRGGGESGRVRGGRGPGARIR